MNMIKCPCGSGNKFSECCEPYFLILGLRKAQPTSDTTLREWLDVFSEPIIESFRSKTKSFIYRMSWYLDAVMDQYFPIEIDQISPDEERISRAIKLQILHTILAALSCLSQGLFIQSGILVRSVIENCLVLIDLVENNQFDKVISGKYSTNGLVTRVKNFIPPSLINWYGYFSANFTHFGPLHPAPYLPTGCYSDNWVIVVGLQNMVRAIVASHIVYERVYFNKVSLHLFWTKSDVDSNLKFDEDSSVFIWTAKFGEDLISLYPPNERKQGFFYDPQDYQTK